MLSWRTRKATKPIKSLASVRSLMRTLEGPFAARSANILCEVRLGIWLYLTGRKGLVRCCRISPSARRDAPRCLPAASPWPCRAAARPPASRSTTAPSLPRTRAARSSRAWTLACRPTGSKSGSRSIGNVFDGVAQTSPPLPFPSLSFRFALGYIDADFSDQRPIRERSPRSARKTKLVPLPKAN